MIHDTFASAGRGGQGLLQPTTNGLFQADGIDTRDPRRQAQLQRDPDQRGLGVYLARYAQSVHLCAAALPLQLRAYPRKILGKTGKTALGNGGPKAMRNFNVDVGHGDSWRDSNTHAVPPDYIRRSGALR